MQTNVSATAAVTIRFVMPHDALAPYVTTLYHLEVGDLGGGMLEDLFHPEWANIRFLDGPRRLAAVGEAPLQPVPRRVLSGPSSMCTRFRTGTGRVWGIGLLPLGWAKFCEGNAADYRDRICDTEEESGLAHLAALGDGLFDGPADVRAEAALLQERLQALLSRPVRSEERIARVNAALVDPAVQSVAELADHAALTARTLERLCRRAFGFPPKLLLCRQRFLRSLASYMLDPSMNWIDSIDFGYHDQAHFVRDFHRFMNMSPSAYSQLDKPILAAAVRGRMEAAGQAMQVLHRPSTGSTA